MATRGNVNAGRLRNLITVQVNTETHDDSGFGGIKNSWATHFTAWARINTITGREFLGSDKVQGQATHTFTFRDRVDLSKVLVEMRVSWNSRIFDIQYVNEINEKRRMVQLITVERDV